jgi:YEATS domain-containing protein 4
VFGSEAWPLTEAEKKSNKTQPNATHGWRVYVRPVPGGPDLTTWLKRVTFTLHETFPNPVRSVENVNPTNGGFELEESAYGGFQIPIKLYFQQVSLEKQQQRLHYLQLEPYSGDPDPVKAAEEREKMIKDRLVRSETVEFIEFNEPQEGLFDSLTSDTQFDYLKPKGKGGKARHSISAQAQAAYDPDANIGEPPAKAPKDQLWSKEQEEALLQQLQKAGEMVDAELAKSLQRNVELGEARNKLKAGEPVDDALLALYKSLPAVPKKK